VIDESTGLPVANATVELTVDGPEPQVLSAGPSDAGGIAEATWSTRAPNKKGQGGTSPGTYTAIVTAVSAQGYTWDGTTTSVTFTLQ
jgi:hypothetical protein